jgi:hypothetical protein
LQEQNELLKQQLNQNATDQARLQKHEELANTLLERGIATMADRVLHLN